MQGRRGLKVNIIPGPCALIAALSLMGYSGTQFQFVGFLPKKEMQLQHLFIKLLIYDGVSIAYESPHRLLKTLTQFNHLFPEAEIFVTRELTKKHETSIKGKVRDLLKHFEQTHPRGELTLLIQGNRSLAFQGEDPYNYVHKLQEIFPLDKKQAIELAAKQLALPKRVIYDTMHRSCPKSRS